MKTWTEDNPKTDLSWMVEPLLVDPRETLAETALHFLDNDTTTNIVVASPTAVVALARILTNKDSNMKRFKDKVVIVTGAGSGIGAATAALAAFGYA